MEPESKSRMPRLPGWVWWVLLVFLIGWNVGLFKLGQPSEADVPYSTFIAQVQAGNVERVKIAGDEISGTFVQAVSLPESDASAAQTPSSSSQSTPVPATLYTDFRTIFPETVGDAGLMSLLEARGVVVNVAPPPSPWLTILVSNGLPLLLLVGVMVWMGRRATQSQNGLFGFGRTQARRYTGDRPQVTFQDVAGADEVKAERPWSGWWMRCCTKRPWIGKHWSRFLAHVPRLMWTW